jgi:hypothetical protein
MTGQSRRRPGCASSLLPTIMVLLSPTFFFFFSLPVLVLSATNTSSSDTDTCNPAHNGLASGTLQFGSDCNATTWCDGGTCSNKQCRRDRFPLGYDTGGGGLGNGKHITPPLFCPSDQFCPDEGSKCSPKIAVGQPCQFNRDGSIVSLSLMPSSLISSYSSLDSCEGAHNYWELRDPAGTGRNVNGSVCLNFVCQCVV